MRRFLGNKLCLESVVLLTDNICEKVRPLGNCFPKKEPLIRVGHFYQTSNSDSAADIYQDNRNPYSARALYRE